MAQTFPSIDEALASIDFYALTSAMRILRWEYVGKPVTPEMIKDTLLELHRGLTPTMNETVSASTGGFTVSLTQYDDAPALVGVRFSISDNLIIEETSCTST